MVRLRKKNPGASASSITDPKSSPSSSSSSSSSANDLPNEKVAMSDSNGLRVGGTAWNQRQQWMFFAVASGACAAFNGVFAKLTTTGLTTGLSHSIAGALGLSNIESFVELVVRGIFFGLNLTFNGIMWSLFTTALARGTSTTQVSIMNTSTNFVITAVLGSLIFSEILPPMWWAGAVLLIAGNVIVGRKDETKDPDSPAEGEYDPVPQEDGPSEDARKDDDDEDVIDLGDITEDRTR